jgi:hypothetical protein
MMGRAGRHSVSRQVAATETRGAAPIKRKAVTPGSQTRPTNQRRLACTGDAHVGGSVTRAAPECDLGCFVMIPGMPVLHPRLAAIWAKQLTGAVDGYALEFFRHAAASWALIGFRRLQPQLQILFFPK